MVGLPKTFGEDSSSKSPKTISYKQSLNWFVLSKINGIGFFQINITSFQIAIAEQNSFL